MRWLLFIIRSQTNEYERLPHRTSLTRCKLYQIHSDISAWPVCMSDCIQYLLFFYQIRVKKVKKIMLLMLLSASTLSHAEVINLVATSRPPVCTHGEVCEIRGYHEIHAINASKISETMRYMYQLCMDTTCDNAQNIVTVYPGQRWDNTRQSLLKFKLRQGKHSYIVLTECGKEKTYNNYTFYVK